MAILRSDRGTAWGTDRHVQVDWRVEEDAAYWLHFDEVVPAAFGFFWIEWAHGQPILFYAIALFFLCSWESCGFGGLAPVRLGFCALLVSDELVFPRIRKEKIMNVV